MPFRDLREFIDKVQKADAVQVIEGADWDLEIGSITEIMAGKTEHPLLIFDKIKGYPAGYRVISNILNRPQRTALALELPHALSAVELVKLWKERLKIVTPIQPVEVKNGPVQENVQRGGEVDLLKFPTPKWHELDGGRYIGTASAVITRDPDDGWVNIGTYRIQVLDRNTLGFYVSPGHHARIIREKYWAKGKICPVAITFGQEPAVWISATYAVPYGMSEYDFAGWMRGEGVEVIEGEYTGLPIPATAEIAIEGDAPPPQEEARVEGPFGEWPGYYAHGARTEPIVRVKVVMHRHNPIIAGAPPLKPPITTLGIPFAASAIWDQLEKVGIPDIKGVWLYASGSSAGGGAPFIVVAIKQRYAGHARQTAMAAASCRSGAYHGRFVIVVDDDIDPANIGEVVWALASRCDPQNSINIATNCWSTPLDAIMHPDKKDVGDLTNSRALIDACRPYHWIDRFPPVNALSPELRQKTMKKWEKLLA